MHHPVIGQVIDCLHQREFVNKTLTCSIICVIRSKYNAVMSSYEVIIGCYEVIKGYYGLFRVKTGFCRTGVLALGPPGLEFRILCLEDSVISIISPSSGGSPDPV